MLLAALALPPATTVAAPTACPEQFLRGEPPALASPKLARDTRELCFSSFAVLHSGTTRSPLWSAEHLTPGCVQAAEALPRKNSFHAEPALPREERAELADYAGSGHDRGHMAPDGDRPDAPRRTRASAWRTWSRRTRA